MPASSPPGPAWYRYDVPARPDEVEILSARLWAAGAVGVWEQPGRVVAWFARPDADVPGGGTWGEEEDRDWQEAWKATIRPVRAGSVAVVPTWLADEHAARPGELTLVLDPGRAFGSGHHATTALCLELLDELELEGRTVADVGCGTGILAIAAARRGASVVAVDIDPDAVAVTRDNAARNGVPGIDARTGSVDAVPAPVDVVVANLVTDVVAALARDLVARTRGILIASGITVERRARALDALDAAGLHVEITRTRDGWLALRGTPRAAGAGEPPPAGRAGAVAGPGRTPPR